MATVRVLIILLTAHQIQSSEDGYLRYVKDGCFKKGEALSCVKYKALKIATKTLFGDNMQNETIKANHMISFVPLEDSVIEKFKIEKNESSIVEPRGFMSEWAELAKYFMKLIQDFFRVKGMKVDLPDGARTVEEEEVNMEDGSVPAYEMMKSGLTPALKIGRGRKKKLAIVVPLLTLLAAIKTKLLLIPVLLSVLLIKKLLLIAALLVPSLLNTLKACKHHPTHYSYFGSSDNSDFSSDYGSSYSYGANAAYGASNRAYTMPKHRPTPSPVYITAPGAAA